MKHLLIVARVTALALLRDRILHALLGSCLVLLLLVPALSLFSMRQVQEVAITLALSAASFILLVMAVLLGASSVWRDIEKRMTGALLGLPLTRGVYLLGKFAAIALFLIFCSTILGLTTLGVVAVARSLFPDPPPVAAGMIMVSALMDGLKFVLLAAIAMLFSTLSTSFFLPVFGTIAIYLAGSASLEVMEFISGPSGEKLHEVTRLFARGCYYLLPNFSAFDLKTWAIYGLPPDPLGIAYALGYFLVYLAIVLTVAHWSFSRRELP